MACLFICGLQRGALHWATTLITQMHCHVQGGSDLPKTSEQPSSPFRSTKDASEQTPEASSQEHEGGIVEIGPLAAITTTFHHFPAVPGADVGVLQLPSPAAQCW